MANGSCSVPSPLTANFCQGLKGMRISCVRPRDKIAFALYAERVRDTALGGSKEGKQPWTFSQGNCQPPCGDVGLPRRRNVPCGGLGCGRPFCSPVLGRPRPAGFGVGSGRVGRPRPWRAPVATTGAARGEPRQGLAGPWRKPEWTSSLGPRSEGTEAGEAGGRPAYLTTLPAALIRFRRFQKKKRAKSPIFKKPPEPQLNDSLERLRGLCCMVIPCCQRFNNVRCFSVFYCVSFYISGMVFGLVDVIIANFHKGYYLKIIEESVLQSSYDISSGLIAIFVAHCGGRAKRTTGMAVSSFLIGVGSLFFAFPFFNNRNYEFKVEIEGLAEASGVVGYSLGYVIAAPFLKASENSTSEKKTGQLGNLTAPCNEKCKCSSSLYSSICGRDDIEYFSPCFAGCKHSKTLHGQKVYYNCSCIKEGLMTTDEQGDSIDAGPGKCDTKCYKLPLFIAFIFSALVFSVFSAVPITLAIFQKKAFDILLVGAKFAVSIARIIDSDENSPQPGPSGLTQAHIQTAEDSDSKYLSSASFEDKLDHNEFCKSQENAPEISVVVPAQGQKAGENSSASEHFSHVSLASKLVLVDEDGIHQLPQDVSCLGSSEMSRPQDLEQRETYSSLPHTSVHSHLTNMPFMSSDDKEKKRAMKIYYMCVPMKRGVAVLSDTEEGLEP
ncbi:uncharacterized protein LOC134370492 [Cynocephalus volans]|uniref:uncharacterized protein LOC134370492 n=1 Tax=Cynocephalus volans TaxID=110931 RepID=UPI002FCCAAF1